MEPRSEDPAVANERAGHEFDYQAGVSSDVELLGLIARGDSDALAEAYERHGAHVYSLAQSMCGPMAAVEVTRTVFFMLWRSPGVFDSDIDTLRSRLLDETSSLSLDLLTAAPGDPDLLEAPARSAATNERVRSITSTPPHPRQKDQ